MPATSFNIQPPRLPEDTPIPRHNDDCEQLFRTFQTNHNFPQIRLADETYLIRFNTTDGHTLYQLVWYGLPIVSYLPDQWIIFKTDGFFGFRAVLDIFSRVLSAPSQIIIEAVGENFIDFKCNSYIIKAYASGPNNTLGHLKQQKVLHDNLALHPGTGTILFDPFSILASRSENENEQANTN